jgi:hypothetical protein
VVPCGIAWWRPMLPPPHRWCRAGGAPGVADGGLARAQGRPRAHDPDQVRDLQRARHGRYLPGHALALCFWPHHHNRRGFWQRWVAIRARLRGVGLAAAILRSHISGRGLTEYMLVISTERGYAFTTTAITTSWRSCPGREVGVAVKPPRHPLLVAILSARQAWREPSRPRRTRASAGARREVVLWRVPANAGQRARNRIFTR